MSESPGVLAVGVADSMKARPAGDCVQSVAGRNSLFSALKYELPLYVVFQGADQVTTSCVLGFNP